MFNMNTPMTLHTWKESKMKNILAIVIEGKAVAAILSSRSSYANGCRAPKVIARRAAARKINSLCRNAPEATKQRLETGAALFGTSARTLKCS
jgi:hypothetical protein